jgi:hypothetical protein
MEKYILCVCSQDVLAGASPIRVQSDLAGFQSDLDPTLFRANPTNGEIFLMRSEK